MRKQGTYGRTNRFKQITWLIIVAGIAGLLLIPCFAQAEALKTTIHEIILNASHYNGKTLTVEGIVKDLKTDTSKRGRHLTSFDLTSEHSSSAVKVSTHKRLHLQEGDYVRVTGRFRQNVVSPACCWQESIAAATVTKVNQETRK